MSKLELEQIKTSNVTAEQFTTAFLKADAKIQRRIITDMLSIAVVAPSFTFDEGVPNKFIEDTINWLNQPQNNNQRLMLVRVLDKIQLELLKSQAEPLRPEMHHASTERIAEQMKRKGFLK